ncbi:hypothetical protein [Streptomyces sp. 8N706]|uniref:hypothetical protein n=1 Tax=Streptomyces sp. 8N706 TaxID=3457416 RepID=UPI003FD4D9F2
MTALRLADAGEAADLAAFLARLIHYDRRAVVRLQAGAGGAPAEPGGVLAVFGRPASFEVLAIRTARLAERPAPRGHAGGRAQTPSVGEPAALDVTVSAGQLADAIDAGLAAVTGPTAEAGASGGTDPGGAPVSERAPAGASPGGIREQSSGASDAFRPGPVGSRKVPTESPAGSTGGGPAVTVPEPVTGPPWAGLLPPRGGWQRVEGLPAAEAVRGAVAAAVTEFRARTESLPEGRRTRSELDRIGREIWSRTLGETELPLRAVHAAQSLGFLRPLPAAVTTPRATGVPGPRGNGATTVLAAAPPATEPAPPATEPALLATGGWLRLRTPYGSIAVRRAGLQGLGVMPV